MKNNGGRFANRTSAPMGSGPYSYPYRGGVYLLFAFQFSVSKPVSPNSWLMDIPLRLPVL